MLCSSPSPTPSPSRTSARILLPSLQLVPRIHNKSNFNFSTIFTHTRTFATGKVMPLPPQPPSPSLPPSLSH